jgi:hypothetical protein
MIGMRRRLPLALLLPLLAALLATSLPTASARSAAWVNTVSAAKDASGDVAWSSGSASNPQSGVSPRFADGDITTIRTTFRPDAVVVLLHFRALKAVGTWGEHFLLFHSSVRVRQVEVVVGPNNWGGTLTVFDRLGRRVACRGVTWAIDYESPWVQVGIPVSCLGDPTWVRTGAMTLTDFNGRTYRDDARRTGITDGATVLGPRIRQPYQVLS